MNKRHAVYVYGTLRPGLNTDTFIVPGVMYDLGHYPGIKLSEDSVANTVLCERIEVDDEGLKRLDGYEGYCPSDPDSSLYLRVSFLDGWIYEYNGHPDNRPKVVGGDWLKHTGVNAGTAKGMGER